jgi:transcriptional regulator with XRE-family HTH domain
MVDIGTGVRMARARARLTQEALCQEAGLCRATLSGIEHGANTTLETLSRIAYACSVPLSQLIAWGEVPR